MKITTRIMSPDAPSTLTIDGWPAEVWPRVKVLLDERRRAESRLARSQLAVRRLAKMVRRSGEAVLEANCLDDVYRNYRRIAAEVKS